jgi:GNAT superfamily N-acetyltransferase
MLTEEQKLDNPVWYSLSETHQDFAVNYEGIKFYDPSYCAFGGFVAVAETLTGNDEYLKQIADFYIVGEKPYCSNRLRISKELVCNQMVLAIPVNMEITETITWLQTPQQKKDLFDLVNLVQPGYFKEETAQLGSYYGIYKNGTLIAAAGERMKMDTYTEVSAIVTHPEHTGKGYAKQLIAHACSRIFSAHKIPYLHVAENNTGAISLYEKLGFLTRRKISFWHLVSTGLL